MTPARFGLIDFEEFHTAGPVDLGAVAPDPKLRPIAFRVDGRAYTYSVSVSDGFTMTAGDDRAHTIVELERSDWSDFVWELRTCFALLYADRLSFPRGHFGHLAAWEPALRAAFNGQVVYDLTSPPPVLDTAGNPLDMETSFTLGDDDDTIRDFLERAGFVHLRAVYELDEIEAVSADVDAAIARATPHDKRSWWTTVDGADVCNRVNYLNEQSRLIAGLGEDPRMRRIAALGGPGLREAADRLDGHGVVIKVPGADSGLADLPWHRDCGMGGHPVKCPLLNVGIQLDAATAGTGQLHVLAGSHRGTSRLPTPEETKGLPVRAIDTRPGDVTVHFGHTLHAAPAPTHRHGAGRRAVYLSYVAPQTFEMVGPGQGYNDVLFVRDEGWVHHVGELR